MMIVGWVELLRDPTIAAVASLAVLGLAHALDPTYDRLNRPAIELQITLIISAKPEIGLAAAAGGDGGTIDGDDCSGAGEPAAATG